MKLYTKKEILPIVLILIIMAVGLYFWPQLPDRVPSHWNINGQIDGWSSRNFAVFFFPALIAGLYVLLSFLPLMDPLRKNIELFAEAYWGFKVIFILFMGGLYLLTLWVGLGHQVDVSRAVIAGIGILFLFVGWMLPKAKRNYMIGIRLPWTLHSDVVWEKTHRLGGKLFIAMAILMFLSIFLPGPDAFGILIGGIILLLAVLFGYSYREWKIIEKANKF